MYLIVIAWLYVTLLMALAEAFSSQGTVFGAIITFLLYGVLPMSLVIYLAGTPLRRKEIRRQEQRELKPINPSESLLQPNASGHATGVSEDSTVAPMGKEP
ncbi:hypothetical protein B9Z52_15165 [Limnohabitans sp. Jir72]|nr:hypothetical protein [Limnohabitans sp. Jir72]PUE28040.1 hypothetical protein B9Z52_15165 [Limnohabitans sp. Jir72]